MEERELDCRGLSCPQPVIETRQALAGLPQEGWLRVILDSPSAFANVRRFAKSHGYPVEATEDGKEYQLRIRKVGGTGASTSAPAACDVSQGRGAVVYVSSEVMGRGDDELGMRLMAVYLDTLSQFAKEISHLIFVNAGVKLAVEGSPVLEQINGLERMGVKVLSCGTCLNHFAVADRLRAGSISNMLAILEVLCGARKVLSP